MNLTEATFDFLMALLQIKRAFDPGITYVCNLYARSPEEGYMVLEELTHRSDLYRPRVVRVSLPPVGSGSY